MTVKTNEFKLEKLHNEWLNNLSAYLKQLQNIDSITRQMQISEQDLITQIDLKQLRNTILLQKSVVNSLANEVVEIRQSCIKENVDKIITIGILVTNNNLRDRIRKAEQSVFTLKYQVNKLLSKAS